MPYWLVYYNKDYSMENNESILSNSSLDDMAAVQLEGTAKWAYFISVVFFILSGFALLLSLLLFANIETILPRLSQVFAISQEVEDFILNSGMILAIFGILLGTTLLFLNGFFLLKFRNHARAYALDQQENHLNAGIDNLNRYLILSTAVNGISIVSTFVGIIFLFFKA